jgi:subtilase family serine protease
MPLSWLRNLWRRCSSKASTRNGVRKARRCPMGTRLELEELESRRLLSLATSTLAQSADAPSPNPDPNAYTPLQIQQAYGFNLIQFGSGGHVAGDGTGQTIAIVDAYDDPNIAADLHTFDIQYGLPDPMLTRVGQDGTFNLPGTDPTGGWELEISLDVEWAHALAPQANILLVEASTDLYKAVDTARATQGVSVVSMSWADPESIHGPADDYHFTTPAGHLVGGVAGGVTFIAAAGDWGQEALYPAVSPNVLAVAGTDLVVATLPGTSTRISSAISLETGWSQSGGGVSTTELRPSYQHGLVGQSANTRTAPDVAFSASPTHGFSVCDTFSNPAVPWYMVGGTSASAPAWAALIAIADQGRRQAGQGTLDGPSQTLPSIYALSASDFHDIVEGNNGAPTTSG